MIEGRLAQANGRLKISNVGVSIEVKGNRLYLRATLPPKPDSGKEKPFQQRLTRGYHANPAGLKLQGGFIQEKNCLDSLFFRWCSSKTVSIWTKQSGFWIFLLVYETTLPCWFETGKQEARKLGVLLDCREFSWKPYLTASAVNSTLDHSQLVPNHSPWINIRANRKSPLKRTEPEFQPRSMGFERWARNFRSGRLLPEVQDLS